MKPHAIASILLVSSHLIWGCQTYKPIEKATLPSDPARSKAENTSQQMALLNEGDRISITLTNEVNHDLIFLAIDGDTLSAKLQKPKTSIPMKIPLNRIQEVKVEQVDVAMTLILSTLTAGLVVILAINAMNNMEFF